MKISVVIPVINEAELIATAVEKAWQARADEVVVVDGGSTDETAKIASSCDCKLVHSNPGRGIQLNAGVQNATGDIFLFLHVDTWLVPNGCNQIRELAESISNKSHTNSDSAPTETILFGGFRQIINDSKWIYRWIERGNAIRLRWQRLAYGDQGIFVSRRVFEMVDGFADVPIMEDFIFSQRASKIARPILLSGPLSVNARRWQQTGPVWQTIRNWLMATAFRCGISPDHLAGFYRRHDR